MITINLVAEGRRPVVARPTKGPSVSLGGGEDIATYMLIVGFLIGGIIFGLWWLRLSGTIKGNDEDIRVAEQTVEELQEIIRQVEEFERKEQELELKIQVITDLKTNQQGPVRIMDEISKALPELLWLDQKRVAGTNVTLSGRAFNTNAVANFLENLDRVPEFQEPVLRDTTQNGQIYTFTISFNFQPIPVGGQPEAAAATPAAD